MQQQQQQQQQQQLQINMTSDEKDHILQRLIFILKNKERKPKDQFKQKNFQEETQFDTILDGLEKNSHISELSSDTHSSYIEIKISDYEAQLLKSLLENLQREVKEALSQLSVQEKIVKGQSDLQSQLISYVIEPKKSSYSDVVRPNILEDSDEEINVRIQKNKSKGKSQKILNEKQLLDTLKNMRSTFDKRLQYLISIKQTNNNPANVKLLKEKTPKFRNYCKENKGDSKILTECSQIINEIQSIFQKYDQETQGLI
ncbi:unnamed protein product [Paramecium octaurelia]|uniref:Uncharacterized protein n=1 Tax=Paramecium octaurelia TaxID=43137 RepID=A0A8S1UQY6_PAROT|nr:unnamed protein product [Paramecium octaurelia]